MTEAPDNQAQPPEISYFEQRCAAIGLTPEKNVFEVPDREVQNEFTKMLKNPVLCEDKKTGDILIPLYNLKGEPCTYYWDNPGKLQNGKQKYLDIRRYKPGNERTRIDKGKEKKIKYDIPKGVKSLPWISPNIIEAYRKKTPIDTIVITEGQIKAVAGWLQGLHIFGITGHSNTKDRDSGELHTDIIEVITTLQVKNVVLLYDGDAVMIRPNDIADGKDLRERPNSFFSSARNTRELLKDYFSKRPFDVYFAYVNSKHLDGSPKGLDDLYEAFPADAKDITKEITHFSKQTSNFFVKTNITTGLSKVYEKLHIGTVEQFHIAHNQEIGEKEFVFGGSKYKYDPEKKEIKIVIPGLAKSYFRVGDSYFEKLHVPNKNGVLEYAYHRRLLGTIQADHGKDFVKHVPKYKAFCIKPDHTNYQEIISNCFNRYRPFEHEPSQEDSSCPETLGFLQHIFGDQLDMGLDYIQLLYQRPTQALPILCLVSEENKTGKSTFVKLLKNIFTGNMAIVGNQELESDFNSGWADKLIIACEESFIDKQKTVEKIKGLSTGDRINMNQKGVDSVEIDFFGKFILCSNREHNFIIANERDLRYWVRKVPVFTEERTNLLELMIDEIPNFLLYLNKRTLVHPCESRMWFADHLIRTKAFAKLIEGNTSVAEREIRQFIRGMMLEHGFNRLQYTLGYIHKNVLRGKWDKTYIERLLKEKFKVQISTNAGRYKYPELVMDYSGGENKEDLKLISGLGKPYTFTPDYFLTPEEAASIELCDLAKHIGQEQAGRQATIEELPELKDPF